jgi:hypothetical protein
MGLGRYLQCLSVPEMVSDFMCFLGSRCSTLFNPEIWSCRQISNWWYTYPSEKYEFVSWDDDIPNIWKNKIHVPDHQPDDICICISRDSRIPVYPNYTWLVHRYGLKSYPDSPLLKARVVSTIRHGCCLGKTDGGTIQVDVEP